MPSKCMIVRTMGRSTSTPEVLSRRNRVQNPKRKKKPAFCIRKTQPVSVNPDPSSCPSVRRQNVQRIVRAAAHVRTLRSVVSPAG